MKKQLMALSLLATSLVVLPGCWKCSEEEPKKKTKKVALSDDKAVKSSKTLIDDTKDTLDLDKELIEDLEA